MGIDLKSLGTKLAQYRNQLTESVGEVAAATGIDEARLSKIEGGASEPTGDEVLILADHYRCDYKFFISNEQVAPFKQTDALYRAHEGDFSKADRRAIQDFLYLCETEAFLMQEMGQTTLPFSFSTDDGNFKRNGEAAAAALRSTLNLSEAQVPADVYGEFRKVGVHVFRRKLGNSNISGLFVKHPVAGNCALVNLSEDIYRQRFSATHEMAHAVFDSDEEASVSFERQQGLDLREVRANRFASCFLLPPVVLRKLPEPSLWSEDEAQKWAKEFRVSCQALGVALKGAGLVDDQTSGRIRGFRVPRDAKVDPELPQDFTPMQRTRKQRLLELGLSDFYVGLCFDAFRAGAISVGRLAEALLSSRSELIEIAAVYGRALHGTD